MGKYCSFCGKKLNSDNSVCNCNKKTEKHNAKQIKYGTCLAAVLGISFINVGILALTLNAFDVNINQCF